MSYVYEKEGEYKGFGKRDKYKPRIFKITAEGVFECYEKKKCRITINLLKEPWSGLQEAAGTGKNCKSCWEFQYNGKTYNFASPGDNDRATAMKELKTFYDKAQSMDNAINSSGKYNHDKPNNDDFKEVQSVFEQSTASEFTNGKKNARGKASAQYWKVLKKDPYWKRDLYLLKEKHLPNDKNDMYGGVSSAAAPVDDEKKYDAPVQEEPKKEEPKKKKKGGMFGKFKAAAATAAANATEAAKNAADAAKEKAKEVKDKKQQQNQQNVDEKKDEPQEKDWGYSGKKPKDQVFQDITEVFEKSNHLDFNGWDETKRRKESAQYWKKIKKDKKWIKTMNDFRNKHDGFVTDAGPTTSFVDDGKDDRPAYDNFGANANPFGLVPGEEKKDDDAVENLNPLQPVSLNDLLADGIGAFTHQLGAEAMKIQYDLVASNEFCQIAIGMGLVKGEDEEEEEEIDGDIPAGWKKKQDPDGKIYYQNVSSGEIQTTKPTQDEYKKDGGANELVPNVTHDGSIGKTIEFVPEDNDFTIAFEIKCGRLESGNVLFSNGKFEYVAPRPGSARVAVRLIQKGNSELQNVGETELSQNVWYHIVIVCYRANDEDKRPKTDFKVFLNGVSDGEISIKKASEGGLLSSIGGLFGKKKKKPIVYTPTIGASPIDGNKFYGAIQNVKIFYKALEHNDVKKLAYIKTNMAFMEPAMITYNKNSLCVAVPKCDMRYHGPDMLRLPAGFQEFKPDKTQSFTICAWIYCNRIGATNGSVILTNINDSQYDNTGFEFICPTNKSHVIGLRCSNNYNIIPIGTREIKINKWYHVAITVQRVITRGEEADQTDIAVYVNGKNDGTYNFKKCKDYFDSKNNKTFWTVGHNTKNEQGTRFDGSIGDVRIFFKALPEAEMACVYAACKKERKFKKGHQIYYLQKNKISCPKCKTVYDDWSTTFCGQCGTDLNAAPAGGDDDDSKIDLTSRQTVLPNATWRKGEIMSIDASKCEGSVQDMNNSQRRVVPLNEIIPADDELLIYENFIPGTESQRINNLGGMIHGEDFSGGKFKIYSTEAAFLQYICRPTSMSLLCDPELKDFQKHEFEAMIKNPNINNEYILNRLLYAAHITMIDINGKHILTEEEYNKLSAKKQKEHDVKHSADSKKVWNYFNEYILPWEVWYGDEAKLDIFGGVYSKKNDIYFDDEKTQIKKKMSGKSVNFELLKVVARTLQSKYKKMQLDLFQVLLAEKTDWAIFDLANFDHKTTGIENRQDGFGDDAIGNECEKKYWDIDDIDYEMEGKPMKEWQIYDKKVSTMLLWGRCFILQEPFQIYFKTLYGKYDQFVFSGAGIKTYERMMEKAIEYRCEDGKDHPAAYCICDINRCSIKCNTLDDVREAFKILESCPKDEVKIARIKNRFLPSFDATDAGGYRDMLVNILFKDKYTGMAAIGEVQFHLKKYEYIKHLQHKYYKIDRAVDYKSLLRNYEARKFEKKDKKDQKK